jgi:hypothetical protein
VLLVDLGAGDQSRDLLLLLHLPVDELLDVGMIGIDHHHLGGAARGAAGLDRARGAVADLEKLIRPDDLPPPDEPFAFAAQREKLVPVPEPYLNRRASRTHRSMMPPSLTRSSEMPG